MQNFKAFFKVLLSSLFQIQHSSLHEPEGKTTHFEISIQVSRERTLEFGNGNNR